MAPQRFASARYKSHPAARLAPFRDDTGLVALRYEQTKQAEPPIPIPPRNPLRIIRPPSTITSSNFRGPIVIVPPAVPPPREEHPAFRASPQQQPWSSRASYERKRDSGLAPTTASSVTLREECDGEFLYEKIIDEIWEAASVFHSDCDDKLRPRALSSPTRPAPLTLFTIPSPRAPSLESPTEPSPTESTQTQSTATTTTTAATTATKRRTSLTEKLSKAFSLRSGSSRRQRNKTLSEDMATTTPDALSAAAPASERGSLKSPRMSPKTPPRSPTIRPSTDKDRDTPASLPAESNFAPITTSIPEVSWDDLNSLEFSKRGSVMLLGKRALGGKAPLGPSLMARTDESFAPIQEKPQLATASESSIADGDANEQPRASTAHEGSPSLPSIRVVSVDIERESQKVRSLYESGESLNWQDGGRVSFCERLEPTEEVPSDEEENVVSSPQSQQPPSGDRLNPTRTPHVGTPRSVSSISLRPDSQVRKEYERAGGLEDWEDVEGGDVDRYGFISQRRPESRNDTAELKSSQFSPRRRNLLTKRPDSAYSNSPLGGLMRPPSRKVSTRSLNTYTSELSTTSRRSTRSSIRSATNHLPHNRDRRWMDEAGDMLTMQPGLTDIAEDERSTKVAEALKRKEWERSEKWRKMAKVIKKGAEGQGMDFEFDTKNPKLIERTWKGIPDRWRAAAWNSFLATSAKNWKSTETEEQLMAEFRRLQDVSSPDDVQIDLDVPRTINQHIMFRRRYRGGQRLLFRVLHAISLYFPNTGYVQGMASLAATLLCYYDEERCFVMLVRMWRYRGLERLYQPGFSGLMSSLSDFEKRWLADNKVVASKLTELCIDPTAYGTRWYLTIFNLSIPFPAQLRVWDVFMLLGECSPEPSSTTAPSTPTGGSKEASLKGLDILHAASAALIQALREVLLDSDFENAMKALTSWIPVKDEELLMKVTRAEWRQHQGKKKEKDKA
ncbi:hypothetical protein QBC46DRAFT_419852 [Diplogelasinospora grovesii]|uniref:Rab-GAP TBC domain-containing protein n=1 Tax=Diplogelasinospora grovesii TaxID=303347 RepID=A0AAN6NE92_9PEZI|nr:hypothetical protein QBC46DRAFT_419852 [Diplogelasinospora grovesii]